jgi:hypothetical protein
MISPVRRNLQAEPPVPLSAGSRVTPTGSLVAALRRESSGRLAG